MAISVRCIRERRLKALAGGSQSHGTDSTARSESLLPGRQRYLHRAGGGWNHCGVTHDLQGTSEERRVLDVTFTDSEGVLTMAGYHLAAALPAIR
jgi:hypothetical protein